MIGDLDLGALLNGSLWAMFVPFDGTGAKLVP
jgi:hypothetical protein